MKYKGELEIEPDELDRFCESVAPKVADIILKKLQLISNHKLMAEDRVISRLEFMKEYNISSSALHRHIKEGSLPHFRVGRKIFFRESEVREALKSF